MLIECLPGTTVSKTDMLPFILYDRNTLTSDTDKPSCFKQYNQKKSTEKYIIRGNNFVWEFGDAFLRKWFFNLNPKNR